MLKNEVSEIKQMHFATPRPQLHDLATEVANLRLEVIGLKSLQQPHSAPVNHSAPDEPSPMQGPRTSSQRCTASESRPVLRVTAWNCRGFFKSLPYLQHLTSNHDILILSEHWLWPYELHKFNEVHPDFTGLGIADNRLNEDSNLTRGCGGVGIIWRNNLAADPVRTNADRLFAVQLQLPTLESISVIGVYLPPTDHPLDTYREYLMELEGLVSSLQHCGPVLIMGDFNAHLGSLGGPRGCGTTNSQGTLNSSLMPTSLQCL